MGSSGKDQLGRKLLQIKETLEGKKTLRSELQGERRTLLGQLNEFGVKTLDQAEKLIQKEEKELKELESTLQIGVDELEQLMEG